MVDVTKFQMSNGTAFGFGNIRAQVSVNLDALERTMEQLTAAFGPSLPSAFKMSAMTWNALRVFIDMHEPTDTSFINPFGVSIWFDNNLPFGEFKQGKIIKGEFHEQTRAKEGIHL